MIKLFNKLKSIYLVLLSAICANAFTQESMAQSPAHTPLREGYKQYERSQYKKAEKAYRSAAEKEPSNPNTLYNLGNSCYQQSKYDEAARHFEQSAASEQNPERRADALHNLGNAELRQRRYPEAVKAYEESLRYRPGDPQTKMNLQMAKKKLESEKF